MAKAKADITLYSVVDISKVTRYYILKSSTASAPSKPTTNPPSGWTTTEPTYTSGSTNTLYFVDLTEFTNGTFDYSVVSKSSSYEAAKAAYNKAINAQNTADQAQEDIDNLEIGGRNLLKNSRLIQMHSNNNDIYPISCVETSEGDVTFYRVRRVDTDTYPTATMSLYSGIHITMFNYTEMTGKQVTLSFKARTSHDTTGSFMANTYTDGSSDRIAFTKSSESFTTQWKTYSLVIDEFPDMTDRTGIRWNPYSFTLSSDILADFYLDIRDYKFEIGNRATDWTPATEDTDAAIDNLSTRISEADAEFIALKNSISTLVVAPEGSSIVQHNGSGETYFDLTDLLNNIEANKEEMDKYVNDINKLIGDAASLDAALETLDKTVGDIETSIEYVHKGRYEDEPCLILGDTDNLFKVIITNTRMLFLDGTYVPAYITNSALKIKRAEVEGDLSFSDRNDYKDEFVWKRRANGNLGLMWKEMQINGN